MKSSIVIKIGGSVIYDNSLNVNENLLDKLKEWYRRNREDYKDVVIVVGGGTLSRDLQNKIAQHVGGEEYLHSIGMSVTHTNANLVRAYLGDPEIVVPQRLGEAYELLMGEERVSIVCGGLKVGWSTDMDAALFADILGESKINKISSIDYIYSEDPTVVEDATPIKDITWKEYFNLFNIQEDSIHAPNKNIPIDVECARFCKRKEISFWISGGKKVNEVELFEDIMSEGTLVHP